MRRAVPFLLLVPGAWLIARAVAQVGGAGRPGLAALVVQLGLVVLPVVGLAAAARFRAVPSAIAAAAWPLAVTWALPLWLPEARAPAPVVIERTVPVPVEPPAPPAPPAPAVQEPPPREDVVRLAYEGSGRSLRVPVTLDGPRGRTVRTRMLFDTGASMTTLDRDTLRDLGIDVPRDAPRATFKIASGDTIESALVLVDRVHLGGHVVEGVTVGVCDRCRPGDGLLGLNVAGQFRVTVDPDVSRIELVPMTGVPERANDVRRWVSLSASARGEVVTVTAHNRADRRVDELRILLTCAHGGAELVIDGVPPSGTATGSARVDERCSSGRMEITSALW